MAKKTLITGPTFEEMLHPEKIDPKTRKAAIKMRDEDPLDPINLFNITWKDDDNKILTTDQRITLEQIAGSKYKKRDPYERRKGESIEEYARRINKLLKK